MQREQARSQRVAGQPRRLRRRLRARADLRSSSSTDDSSFPRDIGLGLGLSLMDDDDDKDEDTSDLGLDAATTRIIEETRRVTTRLRLASLPQRAAGAGERSWSRALAGLIPNTEEDEEQERQEDDRRGGNDLMTSGYNTL